VVVAADVDVLPVEAVDPVVGGAARGDEHAVRPTTPSATATTVTDPARRVRDAVLDGRHRCDVEVLRS
jgi:hypothetical protein